MMFPAARPLLRSDIGMRRRVALSAPPSLVAPLGYIIMTYADYFLQLPAGQLHGYLLVAPLDSRTLTPTDTEKLVLALRSLVRATDFVAASERNVCILLPNMRKPANLSAIADRFADQVILPGGFARGFAIGVVPILVGSTTLDHLKVSTPNLAHRDRN